MGDRRLLSLSGRKTEAQGGHPQTTVIEHYHRAGAAGEQRKHNVGEVGDGVVVKLCHCTLVCVWIAAFKMGLVLGYCLLESSSWIHVYSNN